MEWSEAVGDGGYIWGRCGPIIGNGAAMGEGFRFLWNATRGHRLRPWRSDYLKWRLETFTGKHAELVGARDFWRFLWGERRQLVRFLRWLGEMREYAGADERE